MRAQRLESMKQDHKNVLLMVNFKYLSLTSIFGKLFSGHGEYDELPGEKELFDIMKKK
jgi:hypothetical protein